MSDYPTREEYEFILASDNKPEWMKDRARVALGLSPDQPIFFIEEKSTCA